METENLTQFDIRTGLVQLLKHYRRCGITQIQTTSDAAAAEKLASQLLTTSDDRPSEQAAPTLTANRVSSVKESAARLSDEDVGARDEVPRKSARPAGGRQLQSSSPVELPGAASQAWQLPVLPLAERQRQFAELDERVRACRQCAELVSFRRQTVFGDGTLLPTICFFGEAPGADEDREGKPFVGRAGQLLTRIIEAMSLKRSDVYILNALKCRPPQNRTPAPAEIDCCRPFAEQQLEILQPKFIVCLGAVAVRSLLHSTASVGQLRGRFHEYRGARVVVTYHPAYLLRTESAKKLVWDDMQMLMREIGLPPSPSG